VFCLSIRKNDEEKKQSTILVASPTEFKPSCSETEISERKIQKLCSYVRKNTIPIKSDLPFFKKSLNNFWKKKSLTHFFSRSKKKQPCLTLSNNVKRPA
jgi:hypothetical protein